MAYSFCNECKFCLKNVVPASNYCEDRINFKCTHPVDGIAIPTGRLLKFKAFKNEYIVAPEWCPIKMEQAKSVEQDTTPKRNKPKRWNRAYSPSLWDIEERLKKVLKDRPISPIHVGDVFSIPPLISENRHKVVVKEIQSYYALCETIDESTKKTIYLYNDSLKRRLIQKIESGKEGNK